MRVPDVAPEPVAGQEAAPRVRAVPVGRAAAGRAPVEEALGGRAPVGSGLRQQERGPWEQEPGSRAPGRPARMVPVRSAAAVDVAASVALGRLAVPIPAPAERDYFAVPNAGAAEPPQGRVGSPVSVRLAALSRGSASQSSAGWPPAPRTDWGLFPAQCWPVWARTCAGVGRASAVCRRAPAKAWVR